MTAALWCVLAALLMPYLWTGAAKALGRYSVEDNREPRAFLARLTGPAARAHAAQLNSFEAFPAFAAAVLVAQYAHASQAAVDGLAFTWIGLRVLYGLLYLADRASARSLVWFGALGCVVALFGIAA